MLYVNYTSISWKKEGQEKSDCVRAYLEMPCLQEKLRKVSIIFTLLKKKEEEIDS